jgi:hypothetical protein
MDRGPLFNRFRSRPAVAKFRFWGAVMVLALFGVFAISCREAVNEPPLPDTEAVTWAADGVITDREYDGSARYEGYEISWKSDGQYIYIGLRAEAAGWVAVGIQPQPLHRETDMVLGFVKDGKASVYDMFSTGEWGPCTADSELGGSDDIVESGGREEGGYTVIEFKRALDTGDGYDGALSPGVNEIMWGYSNFDDPRQKHAERGRGEIEF